MRILINQPHEDREGIEIDTGAQDVEIYEAFTGPIFWTSDGEALGVCFRDSGFELTYSTDYGDTVNITLNNGNVNVR